MKLAAVHARIGTLMLLRYPAYVVPTLIFPAMFFLFFAGQARGAAATLSTCSFAAFAVIGVAFFQFGVGIAAERESPWEVYLRTLPVRGTTRVAARIATAAVFASASAALVVVAGLASTDVSLPATRWAELALVLALGIVPFALLGIALGYWATPRGALPLANLLYLGLAYGGGLWIPPARLPHPVQALSPYLPTRQLTDVVAAIAAGSAWSWRSWGALALFAAAFAVAALAGFRRDEGRRFG